MRPTSIRRGAPSSRSSLTCQTYAHTLSGKDHGRPRTCQTYAHLFDIRVHDPYDARTQSLPAHAQVKLCVMDEGNPVSLSSSARLHAQDLNP